MTDVEVARVEMPFEAPSFDDLVGLPIEMARGDEPWVAVVTLRATDGDAVAVTWDEVAAAAHVRWMAPGGDRLVLEREGVTRVTVRDVSGRIEVRLHLRSEEIQADLMISVGASVVVSDTLLRV